MSEALERLLADLVAIDSTSTRSNLPVVEALERRLTAAGLACTRHRYVDEAGVEKANLLAASGNGPFALTLVGHTDCVPADPAWTDAFRLTPREGLLFGRGACDTKGWLAAMVLATEAVRERLRAPFLLVFTADEELGCAGARRLVAERPFATARAIVGEPTRLTPVRANKGYCLAEVEVHGRAAHSAYPDAGASAVVRAARLIDRLERWARGPLRREVDPAFEPPYATVNVGLLQGGRAKNVVPDRCRFTLEWRPLPAQPLDGALRELERLREELAAEDPELRATVSAPRLDRGFATPADADVVDFLVRATGRSAETVAFGTEAPQLASLGARTCVFGPGDIAVAHQTGEHVSRTELLRAEEVLQAALLHFCASPSVHAD